ncbi:MAG TPA: hypothetical protein PLH37_01170 [bacterium]|nr:hypothetical protein [bacterium]
MQAYLIFTKDPFGTFYQGAFGNSSKSLVAGQLFHVEPYGGWHESQLREQMRSLAVDVVLPGSERTWLATQIFFSEIRDFCPDNVGEVGIAYNICIPGFSETEEGGSPHFSSSGEYHLRIRVVNGEFNPETLEGKFDLKGEYGVTGKYSGNLVNLCEEIVRFGDALGEIGTPGGLTRYVQIKSKLYDLVSVHPFLHFGGETFQIQAYRFGQNILADGQMLNPNEAAKKNENGDLLPFTWAEAIQAQFPFFSDGKKTWVDQPVVEVSYHTSGNWLGDDPYVHGGGFSIPGRWMGFGFAEEALPFIEETLKQKKAVKIIVDGGVREIFLQPGDPIPNNLFVLRHRFDVTKTSKKTFRELIQWLRREPISFDVHHFHAVEMVDGEEEVFHLNLDWDRDGNVIEAAWDRGGGETNPLDQSPRGFKHLVADEYHER